MRKPTIRKRINHFLLRAGRRLQLRRVFAYPEHLQVVSTHACNLRCLNCSKTYYTTDNQHLSAEVYRRVRDSLFPYARSLSLEGLGEPLLGPLFPEMLEDAAKQSLKICFVTNATRLDDKMIKQIVRVGADVAISLDGATAETHERSRPGSRFSQVLESFARFQEERKARPDTDFHLNISTVVNRLNLDEISGLLSIAAKYGITTVCLMNPGVGDRTDLFAREAIGAFPDLFASRIGGLVEQARTLGVHLDYPRLLSGSAPLPGNGTIQDVPPSDSPAPNRSSSPTPDQRFFPARCMDPWNMVYIDVDGWVRWCCRATGVAMGNLLEHDFWDIWNNEHYRSLRGCINTNNPPEFCRSCNLNWGVTGGDERYVEKLKAMGITLPAPPRIGITWGK
jgi:MoaA/NifB/PqqE/SkfB family radical SAM enzyme